MHHYPGFTHIKLQNRLGQLVELDVCYRPTEARDFVFVAGLNQQASSVVGKNAEHFAFQLCEHFQIEPRRFELIEVRDSGSEHVLWRWRFEWVGHSPISPRGELVSSAHQQRMLFGLLNAEQSLKLVATH